MRRQLQIQSNIAQAEWYGNGGFPIPPDDTWIFVDVTDRPDAKCGDTYDAATDTFTSPPPRIPSRVTKSQVISVLTPTEWVHATTSTDPVIVWGMAQFASMDTVELTDPRLAQIFSELVSKGIVTTERAQAIQAALVALAV